jgi:hypothetical protein
MGREVRDEVKDVWDERSGVETEEGSSLSDRDDAVSWSDEQFVDSW